MFKKQMTCVTLIALFLFFLSAGALAESDRDKIECLPEQPSLISPESGDFVSQDRYGIPRKQVLLEIFGRPT